MISISCVGGYMTVKCLQEQVNELRHMILMMTGQGEKEESRGGENDESRRGENKESSGNVREKADKKKKDERRQSMQQKKGKRVSGEGLPGGKIVKVADRRERRDSVRQERSFADVV